jgi:hypothetical protein
MGNLIQQHRDRVVDTTLPNLLIYRLANVTQNLSKIARKTEIIYIIITSS